MKTMKTMKTIFATALVVVGCLFTSCSKDDDENDDQNITLVGDWKSTSMKSESFTNGTSTNVNNHVIDDKNYAILTFSNNGKFSEFIASTEDGNSTDPGIYITDGDKLFLT